MNCKPVHLYVYIFRSLVDALAPSVRDESGTELDELPSTAGELSCCRRRAMIHVV